MESLTSGLALDVVRTPRTSPLGSPQDPPEVPAGPEGTYVTFQLRLDPPTLVISDVAVARFQLAVPPPTTATPASQK